MPLLSSILPGNFGVGAQLPASVLGDIAGSGTGTVFVVAFSVSGSGPVVIDNYQGGGPPPLGTVVITAPNGQQITLTIPAGETNVPLQQIVTFFNENLAIGMTQNQGTGQAVQIWQQLGIQIAQGLEQQQQQVPPPALILAGAEDADLTGQLGSGSETWNDPITYSEIGRTRPTLPISQEIYELMTQRDGGSSSSSNQIGNPGGGGIGP